MRSIGFQLDPDQAEKKFRRLEHLPVTALGDYLKCPFRFYLKHVLGMEAMDDLKSEMDALDFGSLAHGALELLGRDDLRQIEDAGKIATALVDYVQRQAKKLFGSSPPLQITIQLTSLCRRLEQAATVQAAMVSDGWRILEVEIERSITVENVVVRGRVDRLDQHRETGKFRIIDYKVGEKAKIPDRIHLGAPNERTREYALVEEKGKVRCWQDLQLPLYYLLLAADGVKQDNCEAGYFNLPKAVSETDYLPMTDLSPTRILAAECCMQGVLADIGSGRFWPPSPLGGFDEFAPLFFESPGMLFKEPSDG
ncbi:MAG: PD-(D/E)XK nuclease family protein [Deltaproteobacteria bacterium]